MRLAFVLTLLLARTAAAADVCPVEVPQPPPPKAADGSDLTAAGFRAWLTDFRGRALSAGTPAAIFDKAMKGVTFTPKTIERAYNANERTPRISGAFVRYGLPGSCWSTGRLFTGWR